MAKRKFPLPDTWLADFRDSAGLIPPPRTLSNAASRLVDLMDEFLYSLQGGWEIPPGFPRDRFVPTSYGKLDLLAPIVQYLDDFGFTGDASRLHEAARRYCKHQDWQLRQMLPRPGDDKGWQEFQERCVKPLGYLSVCLQGRIRDVRQLIMDAAAREAAVRGKGKEARPDLRAQLTAGLTNSEMNKLGEQVRSNAAMTTVERIQGIMQRMRIQAGSETKVEKKLARSYLSKARNKWPAEYATAEKQFAEAMKSASI